MNRGKPAGTFSDPIKGFNVSTIDRYEPEKLGPTSRIARSFDELAISPNPYTLPAGAPLMVDGLVQNSTLKVLTVEGKLVREIKTPGGKVGFWDGRDTHGELASTGVYLIVAFSEDGSKVQTAKVAVIRR